MSTIRAMQLACPLLLAAAVADAQSVFTPAGDGHRAGSGAWSVGYHWSRTDGINLSDGTRAEIGEVRTHAAQLGLEYYFTDRWSIEANVPFIKRRYRGPRPHNPALLAVPQPGSAFLDDGVYHGGLQDLTVALRYDAVQDFMLLRPFVALTVPTNDYTFFAQSARGQNLVRFELGAELVRPIGLSDFYFRGRYGYVIPERTFGDVNTNHHLLHLELGWYATPRMALRGFALGKFGNGLDTYFRDIPRAELPTTLTWYHHDQTQRHESAIVGVGLAFDLGNRYELSVSGLRMVWGDAIHQLDFATSVELSRHFD